MGNKSMSLLSYLIAAVIALSAVLCLCLSYFVFSGGADQIEDAVEYLANGGTIECQECPEASPCPVIPPSADTSTPEPVITPEASQTPEIASDDYLLVVLTDTNKLDPEYVPENIAVPAVKQNGTQLLCTDAAEAVEEMFKAAAEDGVQLYLISGLRTYSEQVQLWNTYAEKYGKDYADRMDAVPGKSEHQLGYAADFGDYTYPGFHLLENFDKTPAYKWLNENSWKYGWIERYPKGTDDISGVMYSPWSFRYVGKYAQEVIESGKSLETFIDERN